MESTKLTRKINKRKPLTDLTNTNPSSHLYCSSKIKPQIKSSLNLPIKDLLNKNHNLNRNFKTTSTATQFDDNNANAVNKKSKEKGKGPIDKETPSSILSPPSKTPSLSGIRDSLVLEPSSVYKRRHTTADKMKDKQKDIVEPLSCSIETRMSSLRSKRYGYGDIGLSKSCSLPSKKKQHREKAEVNAYMHDLPQGFIEKQRAYFAEIDAFELEEEVASDDELEEMKTKKKKVI